MNKTTRYIRYPLKVSKQVIRLPRHAANIQNINVKVAELEDANSNLSHKLEAVSKQIEDVTTLIHSLDNRIVGLKQELSVRPKNDDIVSDRVVNNTVSDNHSLDHFYKLFEDKFRGTEQDIKQRLTEYLPLFNSLSKNVKSKTIIDIGCGRGEFLSFAKDNSFKAIGVDMNKSMVERANSLGYEAIENDAITYLSSQQKNSLAAITGFHIVEHIPFESLMELFNECYRSLSAGGFVLFETPNPNNLVVGASNFYMDPSHIKPIPPELLAFALESVGFSSEILRLHPVNEKNDHEDKVVEDIMGMVYGPRDYAVVARKL